MAVCAYCVCSGIFARAMECCWLYNIDALNLCEKDTHNEVIKKMP